MTAESGTGTIRVTLAAQPRRSLVFATKTGRAWACWPRMPAWRWGAVLFAVRDA